MSNESPAVILYDSTGRPMGAEARVGSVAAQRPLVVQPFSQGLTLDNQARVADTTLLMSESFRIGIPADVWGQAVVSGGTLTHSTVTNEVALTTTATGGSTAQIQSHTAAPFHPGRTIEAKLLIREPNAGIATVTRRWGSYLLDGAYFERLGTNTLAIGIRSTTGISSPINVLQNAWNVDKMDGTGSSGVTHNPLIQHIYEIRFSAGGVVDFYIDGILVHRVTDAGLTLPLLPACPLPLMVETITNAAGTGGTTFFAGGSITMSAEAGFPAQTFSVANSANVTVLLVDLPILYLRPLVTVAGQANRGTLVPQMLSIECSTVRFRWKLFRRITSLTGGTFAPVGATSIAEATPTTIPTAFSGGQLLATFTTTTVTEGREIDISRFFDIGSGIRHNGLQVTPEDGLLVTAAALTSTGAVRAGLTWKEIR
jgi:hypothetical protein